MTMSDSVVLTREQVRRLDRLAIEEYGIPGVVLMENAGRSVAEVVLQACPPDGLVVILCGGGNNGGDGYVVARHLANAGRRVAVYATKDPARLAGDAAIQACIAQRMDLDIEVLTGAQAAADACRLWAGAAVVVDAILGTGFSGEIRSPLADVIEACNSVAGASIIAVDVPSGLDCETGRPANPTVRADTTVTFVARKAGFGHPDAAPFLGRVLVGDIGAPRSLLDRVRGG